jgi:hypothetical protein
MSLRGLAVPTDRRPRRCAYCGHVCRAGTCRYCADLPKIERRLRDERALVEINLRHVIDAFATMPRGRGRFPMFDSPEADLPRMSDELREAVQATKGKEAECKPTK